MATTAANTTLAFRHIFGFNANVSNNISFTDDDTVVYVAGHSLVLYSLTEKRQRFIQSAEITESITTYSSGSGKRLCAVAEHGDSPSFHVFDLRSFRRKKTITTSDLASKDIVSLQFSEDNQLLLVLTGAPDWVLMCWNWAKAKLIASVNVSGNNPGASVYSCMFSPLDASVACVIGRESVKFFRIGDKEMRPLKENILEGANVTAFCWMRNPDDHLIVGTEEGRLLVFRSGEYLMELPCSPGPEYPIFSLVSISGGFIAGSGTEQGACFLYFSYDDSKDQILFDSQFALAKIVPAHDLSSGFVTSLALCPKDEHLVGTTSDAQIIHLPALAPHSISSENVKYLVSSFHGPKAVTGMDVCVRKPLVMTCARDNTLRLWNFATHELELIKVYPEEMFSVALHPTGLHCAVGFTDKVRLYHILVDDLRLCLELSIKSCRDCKFSTGGNVFAAANGNSIAVFDFHTGERVADLRGHNSKVRSLHWMPSGYQLLTCGQDGAVYLWSLDGAKRTGEFVQKGSVYTSVCNTINGVMVVGNDRSLRELALPDLAPNKLYDAGLVLTNIAISTVKTVLFASTYEYGKPGYIRTYPYPVSGDFDDYPCTNSQISRVRLTPDDGFLIVADEQGCVVVMELRGRQDRYQRSNPTAYMDLTVMPDWSDEVLITRAELDDCSTMVAELKTKVEELKLNNEYQLKLKDMNYSEKIKETTDKFVQDLESAKSKLEMLQEVRVDYEIESIEKSKYMEELHQSNIQNLETGFQAKIMEMVDAYQQLVRDRDAQIERLDEQRRHLVLSHERYVEELTNDYEMKLDEDKQNRLQQEDEKTELERELQETQMQLEDDIDTEIENLKKVYEDKLALSRETTLKYKGENGIMKKKYLLMQRDIEDQKEEMKILQGKEKELHEQIKLLEKEVSAHKKEIKTRDISIGEKEKRIYELKKKNQELDKFKFVLDFKIRELKQQIEPRQMEIMAMREKIKNMDAELEKYHKTNSNLDNLIGDLREKIDRLQAESKAKRMLANQQENVIATFRRDIQSAIVHIQNPDLLVESVQKIVESHGLLTNMKPRMDPEVEGEYTRHREYLAKSVLDLKKKLAAGTQAHMEANNQVMQANMSLIADINHQRDANKLLKNQVQADIGRIRHYAQAANISAQTKQRKAGNNSVGSGSEHSGLASFLGGDNNSGQKGGDFPNLFGNGQKKDKNGGKMNELRGILSAANAATAEGDFVDPTEMLEKNRKRILALRAAIAELESKSAMQALMAQKAFSKEMLPPLDGALGSRSNSFNHNNNGSNNNRISPRSAGGDYGNASLSGMQQVGISLPPVTRETLTPQGSVAGNPAETGAAEDQSLGSFGMQQQEEGEGAGAEAGGYEDEGRMILDSARGPPSMTYATELNEG